MRQQEEKLKAKYGDLKPKKKLIQKVRAFGRTRGDGRKFAQPVSDVTRDDVVTSPRTHRVSSFPRSFTLTHNICALKSHALEQDVKYFDSADYSLQQVRAVHTLALALAPNSAYFCCSPPNRSFSFLFARAARQGAPQR